MMLCQVYPYVIQVKLRIDTKTQTLNQKTSYKKKSEN